jgi:hypothetical protein
MIGPKQPEMITRAFRWWLMGLLLGTLVVGALTRGWWLTFIGRSLVCEENIASADAIVVENFDPDYRLFERAAELQRDGWSARTLVPTRTGSSDSGEANPIAEGIAELMARFARVRHLEIVPIREVEPYSLNAAIQIRDFLIREHVRSILLVSPAFRSRRSALVYRAIMSPLGIRVHCLATFGEYTPENWTTSWHGIQGVIEQFIKLQYYRFFVVLR